MKGFGVGHNLRNGEGRAPLVLEDVEADAWVRVESLVFRV